MNAYIEENMNHNMSVLLINGSVNFYMLNIKVDLNKVMKYQYQNIT